jgi:nicotinamide mononucleotide adenylyltransferase
MDKKSKLISGLTEKKIVKKPNNYFTAAEKHLIIQEMLETGCTKREIWEKYTGHEEEHGQLLRWMRKLGYDDSIPTRRPNFASNPIQVKKKESNQEHSNSFENLQLKKRIEELEKQLKDAEMKAIAFSTMVDIAEKEFNIPIRKKYNTKPSKR